VLFSKVRRKSMAKKPRGISLHKTDILSAREMEVAQDAFQSREISGDVSVRNESGNLSSLAFEGHLTPEFLEESLAPFVHALANLQMMINKMKGVDEEASNIYIQSIQNVTPQALSSPKQGSKRDSKRTFMVGLRKEAKEKSEAPDSSRGARKWRRLEVEVQEGKIVALRRINADGDVEVAKPVILDDDADANEGEQHD
jgi:hypothetical protein